MSARRSDLPPSPSREGPPPPPQTDGPSPSRSANFAPRTHRGSSTTLGRGIEAIVAIEEVVAGQVFKGRRTSLRAGSASQVFARSRTATGDKVAGHRPEGSARVGHAFKTGVGARAPRRVRLPSASAEQLELCCGVLLKGKRHETTAGSFSALTSIAQVTTCIRSGMSNEATSTSLSESRALRASTGSLPNGVLSQRQDANRRFGIPQASAGSCTCGHRTETRVS